MMDVATRLDRARREGERIIDGCAAHPTLDIPACPGWTGMDLLSHVTRVWHMLALFAEQRPEGFPGKELFPPRPEAGAEIDGARAALDRVDTAMRALPAGVAMWSWAVTQSSDYFHRRLHLENLVHRLDIEAAVGELTAVDGDDAADGVDERFTEFVARASARPAGSLHVHRTDGAGEWTMAVVDDAIVVGHEHAKGDAALRGSGLDLLLAVWGRKPITELESFGDPALAESWLELAR